MYPDMGKRGFRCQSLDRFVRSFIHNNRRHTHSLTHPHPAWLLNYGLYTETTLRNVSVYSASEIAVKKP